MIRFLAIIVLICFAICQTSSLPMHQKKVSNNAAFSSSSSVDSILKPRQRRDVYNVLDDCMTVTSKDGHFYYKSNPQDEVPPGMTCGLYLITDPERQVEIEVTHVDVSCDEGGLISIVDGWELNGEFFPSPEDHPLPLEQRIVSECGHRPLKTRFVSSQNAALVQYRVPKYGQGFSLRVRYVKNAEPCNILVEGTSYVYTLNNYGRKINCSVTTLFPASVSLVAIDVGSTESNPMSRSSSRHHLMTHRSASGGVVHKCEEKGMPDYLQIGGSSGLDTANMMVTDSVCGKTRDSRTAEETIACGITTVRLVSSGNHRNVAQVAIRPAEEEELFSASFMCPA